MIINIKEDKDLNVINHSCAHLMAQAVKRLYPHAKFWVGPVIEEGFYYDIDLGNDVIKEEDLKKIEKEMKLITKSGVQIVGEVLTREQALEKFKDDEYKIDLINNMDDDTVITAYTQGEFTDLCRGPHVDSVKMLQNFKLLKVSGAYWKGDANNKMLQRIYGVCFKNKQDLFDHLKALEEIKERDHRRIGKEQELFMTHELIGSGLPIYMPNGAVIRRTLERYILDKELERGYNHVYSPSLANVELYKISGHLDHYKEDMFPQMQLDNSSMVLRPMNCPHHMLIYKNKLHSYRDLPIRIGELAHDFRYEASGSVTGLERVRQMCQNDAHIFVTKEQIKDVFREVIELILDTYKDFNIKDYTFRLSLRDKNNKDKYYDDDMMWETAEAELRKILVESGAEFYEAEGEAAFYGPKLDVQIKTALGHEITLSTCQLDFLLPQKFELEYVAEDGTKQRPIVIHRAILGSIDRFMAYIIEEYKGAFPLWLSPNQVTIIPVNNEYHLEYAKEVENILKKNKIRVVLDSREEKLSYKMREAQKSKTPLTIILGDSERDAKTISFRKFGERETTVLDLDTCSVKLNETINEKKYNM